MRLGSSTMTTRTGRSLHSRITWVEWMQLEAPNPSTPWNTVAPAKPAFRARRTISLPRGRWW